MSWLADRVLGGIDLHAYAELPRVVSGPADYQAYLDHYQQSLLLNMPGALATVVAGTSLIILVLRISRAQEARIARGGVPAPIVPGMTVASPTPGARDGGTIGA